MKGVIGVGINNQIFGSYAYQQNMTMLFRTIKRFTERIRKIDANLKLRGINGRVIV
jgi:hypothetical protein